MTREELQGLIGGYSTGSLSEAERKALFEAALEDQELFDELAREQALKSALEEPGARERLLAALEPRAAPARPWWKMTWAWAAAAAACAVVIAGVALERSTVRVEEVARLQAPEPVAPGVPLPAPTVSPSTPRPAPKVTESVRQSAPPPPTVAVPRPATGPLPADSPAPPAELKKAEAPAEAARADSVAAIAPQQLAAGAPVVAPGPQAFTQGTIGGVAAGARRLSPAAPAAKASRFAFDYSVTPQLVLRVLPYANAFLTVSVMRTSGEEQLASSRPVQAGIQVEMQLPGDATSVMILFSAQAGRTSGGAARPDPLSGTKSDPNPSPDSLLVAQIPLQR